jgi:hypothetical protein
MVMDVPKPPNAEAAAPPREAQSPLRPSCAACQGSPKLQLVAVEPHPTFGTAFESHRFECQRCHRTQTYTMRRRA